MAWTAPRTWTPGETVTASLMNAHVRDNLNTLAVFSRGGTIVNPNGITATINIIVWYATVACTVTNVRGYRVGGGASTSSINARKNGTSNHLSSAKVLTNADTWYDGGAVQNATYAAGDKLEIMLTAVAGSPTQVCVQVDFVLA